MRALLLLAAAALLAAPASALSAKQTVEKEITIQNADGTETLVRQPADEVTPGERVVYSLHYTNDQSEPVSGITLVMPVPEETAYVEGTAERPGATLAVSTDGGASFGPRGAATVVGADGTPRRAEASDITHLRWTVAGPVAPGTTDALVFKADLK